MLRAFGRILILVGLGVGEFARADQALPLCLPASAPLKFDASLKVPSELQTQTRAFRSAWKLFCAQHTKAPASGVKSQGTGKTLHDMLLAAYDLGLAYNGLVDRLSHELHLQRFKANYIAELNSIYQKLRELSVMIPMFEAVFPYNKNLPYPRPSDWLFRQHASYGDAEDKLFFASPVTLFDWTLPPWFQAMGETRQGRCLSAGVFNGVTTLNSTRALAPRLKKKFFKERLEEFEGSLFESYIINRDNKFVCVCNTPLTYTKDLESLTEFARSNDALARWLSPLIDTKYAASGARDTTKPAPVFRYDHDSCRQ